MPINLFLAGEVISTVITKDIISDSTDSLYNTLKNLFDYDCHYLKQKLSEFDLEVKIEVINSYLEKISSTDDKSVQTCLKYIKQIIEKINSELKDIQKIMDDHKTKWFYNWRTANYYSNLNDLKIYINILNSRLDLLFKIN
jgi:hypothetical protein